MVGIGEVVGGAGGGQGRFEEAGWEVRWILV